MRSSSTKSLLLAAVLLVPLIAWAALSAVFTELFPSSPPSGRRSTGMAIQPYDAGVDHAFVYGGFATTVQTGLFYYGTETGNWTTLSPAGGPGGRERHGLGWDPLHARLVLFGGGAQGFPSNTVKNDVWAYNPVANSWAQLTNSAPPTARIDPVFFWVPHLNRFLMYGGTSSYSGTASHFNDTYLLDPNPTAGTATWALQAVTGALPTATGASCSAYDSTHHTLLVFGGESANSVMLATTHELDLDTWTWSLATVTGTPPTARGFCGTSFDPARGVVVLFGGQLNSGAQAGDLYTFDTVTHVWTQLTPTGTSPGNVSDDAMAYSAALSAHLIFGGNNGTYTNRLFKLALSVSGGTNLPPVVDAGPDLTLGEAQLAVLRGSASDPEGDPMTYDWAQVLGPALALDGGTTLTASFTTPRVTAQTNLAFNLTANDGTNNAVDGVNVTVLDDLNEPPVADAGPNQAVNEQVAVNLSGSGTDPNGEAITYAWTQTAGPAVTLSNASVAKPSFTAPQVFTPQTLTFQLAVTDTRAGVGQDSVSISVADNLNEPPTADAGPDLSRNEQTAVTLSGSGLDPNGEALTYGWTQTAGPAVTLANATTATPGFTTPQVVAPQTLTFQLTVQDPRGGSAQDSISVAVADNLNELPLVDAGPDQAVNEQVAVNLAGSASDPNGEAITYAWTQTAGPAVTLSSTTAAAPSFTSPAVVSPQTLIFRLAATDTRAGTTQDTVSISVADNLNEPPTADAGPDLSRNEQTAVTLSGSGLDPNGEALTYGWTQTAGPAVTLSNAATATPGFTTPQVVAPQTLTFQLTVQDPRGGSAQDSVSVAVADNLNELPLVDAGPDLAVNEQVPVNLAGSASDPNGEALTYAWTQTAGPAVTLSSTSVAGPSFTSPQVVTPQTLTFRLAVTDTRAGTTQDTVSVSVADNLNEPPTADAGPDLPVNEQTAVTLSGSGVDPNGEALTYGWTQTAGPAVTLSNATTAAPGFTTPQVLTSQTLTFRLTVQDARGGSAQDTISLAVADNVNELPVADAGPGATLNEGSPVTLAGSASDPNGEALTLQWQQLSGPSVSLSSTTTAAPSFTAPTVTSPSTIQLQLTATDARGGAAQSQVAFNLLDSINEPPTASAGPDLSANEQSLVTLAGSGTDPNGEALTYAWTQTSGPSVTLSDPAVAAPTFTSPQVLTPQSLSFQLTVQDTRGGTAQDLVAIGIADNLNEPPTADAGAATAVGEGTTVTLAGIASDPNGEPVTLLWEQLSGPAITLSSTSIATPSFTTPTVTAQTDVVLRLTATDARGASAQSQVTITIQDSINEPPVAVAGADLTARSGDTVSLDGTASSDPNGEALSFSWSQLAGPAVTLSATVVAQPSFTAPAVTSPSRVDLRLTVTDLRGATSTDDVGIDLSPPARPCAFLSSVGTTAVCGAAYTATPTVDGDGPFTFALDSGPQGVTVDPTTGAVSWTPLSSQRGPQPLAIRCSGPGGAAVQQVTVDVDCETKALAVGCGCGSSAGAPLALGLLSLALAARRRARR